MAEQHCSDLAAQLTVLFADISGSTALYAERGDVVGHELTARCVELLEAQVRGAGGRVVKRIGDEIFAVFEASGPAVTAAAAMQEALEDPQCDLRAEGIHVRIGMASGSALLDGGDVFGDIVNIAARLVALAGPDEILLATATYETLPDALRACTRHLDSLALRGRSDAVGVYEYLWQLQSEGATIAVTDRTRVAPQPALELQYGSAMLVVAAAHPKVTIGRDDDNAVTIADPVVSRHHADVVMRGDKFLLVDRSTNGTYVLTDAGDKFRVTREELTLTGAGRIYAGSKTIEPIRYRTTTH